VNEVPEEAGTRPKYGRANGRLRWNRSGQAGSVCVHSSAVVFALLDIEGETRRLILHASNAETRPSDAKADRERSEREDRGGGWEWWERVAATGGDRREPVKRDGGAGRGGAVGGEASPSAGWRETAEEMGASEGCSHR
jgi:hypothetical protein